MAAKKKPASAKPAKAGATPEAAEAQEAPEEDEGDGDVSDADQADDADDALAEASDEANDEANDEASDDVSDEANDDVSDEASEGAASGTDAPAAKKPARVSATERGAPEPAAPSASRAATTTGSVPVVGRQPTGRIPITGEQVRTTQALEHGKAAAGAKLIKPGFATTPAGDLAFALGFPHLEYIVDNHPDDARAEMIAYERKSYRLGWPRNVAIRWCRVTACKGFKRTPQGATELDTAGKKAIKNAAPLSTDEIALTLKAIFSDTTSYEDLRDLVRLFEAFAGPELVATSIVDAIEKSSNNVWNHQDQDRALVMHHLGFVLLRLPSSMSDKLRSRLVSVFDRRVKALPNKELAPRKGERGSLLRALDVVLNGKTGVERSGERNEDAIEAGDLVHVLNDAEFVREGACRVSSADARLVFLGGEPVLEHLNDTFVRLRGTHHALIDGFGEVASPKAIELLQRVAKGREAPDRAKAVLAARGV